MNSEFFGQMPGVPHLNGGVAAFLVHLYSPCSRELPGNPEGRDVQMFLPRESQVAPSQGGIWELRPTATWHMVLLGWDMVPLTAFGKALGKGMMVSWAWHFPQWGARAGPDMCS